MGSFSEAESTQFPVFYQYIYTILLYINIFY